MRGAEAETAGENAVILVHDENEAERRDRGQRGHRGPAMRDDARHAARPRQVVGEKRARQHHARGRQQRAERRGDVQRLGHSRREQDEAGEQQPGDEPRRPLGAKRLLGRHRQQLERRAECRRGENAEREQMQHREHTPGADHEIRDFRRGPDHAEPEREVEEHRAGEEAERNRGRQQPALGAAQEIRGRGLGRAVHAALLTPPGSGRGALRRRRPRRSRAASRVRRARDKGTSARARDGR